jgi:transposase
MRSGGTSWANRFHWIFGFAWCAASRPTSRARAVATAVRVQARFAVTGSVDPARQGRPKGSGKLGPYREVILDKVKAQPDITMPDLAAWLEVAHSVTADPSNLSKFLCRHGFTYKKAVPAKAGNAAGIGERTR